MADSATRKPTAAEAFGNAMLGLFGGAAAGFAVWAAAEHLGRRMAQWIGWDWPGLAGWALTGAGGTAVVAAALGIVIAPIVWIARKKSEVPFYALVPGAIGMLPAGAIVGGAMGLLFGGAGGALCGGLSWCLEWLFSTTLPAWLGWMIAGGLCGWSLAAFAMMDANIEVEPLFGGIFGLLGLGVLVMLAIKFEFSPGRAIDWVQSWFSSSPTTRIVARDGSGHHTTLRDAIAAAKAGDRIQVHPGIYLETIMIDKNLDIVGHGPAKDIIIEGVDGACIDMKTEKASLQKLTLRARAGASNKPGSALSATQGDLVLIECELTGDGESCLSACGLAAVTLRNCTLQGGKGVGAILAGQSKAAFENCQIHKHAQSGVKTDNAAYVLLRHCKIQQNGQHALNAGKDSVLTVENCDLTGNNAGPWQLEDGAKVNKSGNRE